MKIKPMWVLVALWVVVAILGWYLGQNHSPTLEQVYTLSFLAAFILSVLHLYRRIKHRGQKE